MIDLLQSIPSPWLALIGAMFGGAGLKYLEHYLSRPKVRDTTASDFRRELREEVKYLRQELRQTELELEGWRTKYYALRELQLKLKEETHALTHPENN